jgi:hypothetical protein
MAKVDHGRMLGMLRMAFYGYYVLEHLGMICLIGTLTVPNMPSQISTMGTYWWGI